MNQPIDKTYDIVVIGGGIAGAAIARDAALRSLSVILFEKNSFASGASSKSSKLIHGGIRYLELSWEDLKKRRFSEAWKNFHFVFTSLKESRILAKTAPSFIKPLSLIIPIYKNDPRKPLSVYCGAFLYYFLSLFCGGGLPPQVFHKKEDVLKLLPALRSEDLVGAVRIWDYVTDDKALVLALIASAKKMGAEAYEQAEVLEYRSRVPEDSFEIKVRRQGNEEIVHAKKVVNASGAWVDKTRARIGEVVPRYVDLVGGSHIEVPSFLPESVILRARDERLFFVIKMEKEARVGTTEWPVEDPDSVSVPERDIDYLLDELNFYFPGKNFERKDILRSDAGVRPLVKSLITRRAHEVPREHRLCVGPDGALHVVGVKLTDHRRAAEEVVDEISLSLGSRKKSFTAFTRLV